MLYDSLVRPVHENSEVSFAMSQEVFQQWKQDVTVGAKLGVPQWFQNLVLSFEAKADETKGKSGGNKQGQSVIIKAQPVETPLRKLEQIVAAYAFSHRSRIMRVAPDAEQAQIWDGLDPRSSPKILCFIELPPQSRIIPTAAEYMDGVVVPIYERLPKAFPAPPYPANPVTQGKSANDYWWPFSVVFDPSKTIQVMEEAQAPGHGRISWIDFRVEIGGKFIHLHAAPAGRCDTGVFAYNFVKRGFKSGTRLIGVMREGPDIHVLAIYDI